MRSGALFLTVMCYMVVCMDDPHYSQSVAATRAEGLVGYSRSNNLPNQVLNYAYYGDRDYGYRTEEYYLNFGTVETGLKTGCVIAGNAGTTSNPLWHVGILASDGQFIHSSASNNKVVKVEPMTISTIFKGGYKIRCLPEGQTIATPQPSSTSCGTCAINSCGCTLFPCSKKYTTTQRYERGIPNGNSVDLPLIDTDFLASVEGKCYCSYIPFTSSCQVAGKSFLTIGTGIDLRGKTSEYFLGLGVTPSTLTALEPVLKIPQDVDILAYCQKVGMSKCLVELSETMTAELDSKVTEYLAKRLETRFNADRASGVPAFAQLPRGVRTVLYSVYHQYGDRLFEFMFWNRYSIRGDWGGAIKELKDFKDKYSTRRNQEAVVMEYALKVNCTQTAAQVDIMFVVDGSGSIAANDFEKQRAYIKSLVESMQIGPNATRVAILTFSMYTKIITSFSESKSDLLALIKSLPHDQSMTYTGDALIAAASLFKNASLNPAVPKAMFLFTDGYSNGATSVATGVTAFTGTAVKRYGVGVGSSFNTGELTLIAGSSSRVYSISDYGELNSLFRNMQQDTCYSAAETQKQANITFSQTANEIRSFSTPVSPTKGATIKFRTPTANVPLVIYYSFTYENPSATLRDGMAIRIDSYTYAFSVLKSSSADNTRRLMQSSADDASLYYTLSSATSVPNMLLETTEGTSQLANCAVQCLSCDYNGQNCQECRAGYIVVRGECEFEAVKGSASSVKPEEGMSLTTIIAIVVGGVVGAIVLSIGIYCLVRKLILRPAQTPVTPNKTLQPPNGFPVSGNSAGTQLAHFESNPQNLPFPGQDSRRSLPEQPNMQLYLLTVAPQQVQTAQASATSPVFQSQVVQPVTNIKPAKPPVKRTKTGGNS